MTGPVHTTGKPPALSGAGVWFSPIPPGQGRRLFPWRIVAAARINRRVRMAVLFLTLTVFGPAARGDAPPDADTDGAFLERVQLAFERLVKQVAPAVVAIGAERNPTSLGNDIATAPLSWVNSGSGVIIRQDGMILTSQHVVDGAIAIHVTLHDGRRYRARLVAADPRADLAILHIQAAGLPVAKLGDAGRVRRGHLVLAMGNPLGLASDGQAAVSQGLVSAIGRPLPQTLGGDEDRYYGDMIQTTAQVNPGHSGGPLIDVHGRVIGVITATAARPGIHEALGFAVPIDARTQAIIHQLLEGKQIEYGYLGVQVADVTGTLAQAAGLPQPGGALIDAVFPDGPAERAGLQEGDIIVSADGITIKSADHFVQLIGAKAPGTEVRTVFLRASKRRTATVKTAHRPPTIGRPRQVRTFSFRGAVLGPLRPSMRGGANLPANALLVRRVAAGSPADRAGLTPGDIIVRVESEPLPPDASAALDALRGDALVGLANGGSALIKSE